MIVTSQRGGETVLKMAFVRSVCRLPFRSLSWSRAAGQRLYSTATNGEGNTSIVKKSEGEGVAEYVAPDELVQVSDLSGIPSEQLKRVARIYMPARNAMQSGTNATHTWNLEFETQERWENPLMGWASSADPLSNMLLQFDTKEEAIAFAVRNGWAYEVAQPKKLKMRPKSYGANFSWDKKTRVVAK